MTTGPASQSAGATAHATSFTLELSPDEHVLYRRRQAARAEQVPSLAVALADPDAFVAQLRSRFAAQKASTPGDPYAFDVMDLARDILASMKSALVDEVEKVEGLPRERSEHAVGRDYLRELEATVARHLTAGTISYRRLLELGFFVARALALFDVEDGSPARVFSAIDRYLQGYQELSPAEEQQRFARNDTSVFREHSPVAGIAPSGKTFAETFFDNDALGMVAFPTTARLGPGPFMRLVADDLYLIGVTPEPAAASGLGPPTGTSWLCDLRHAVAIGQRRRAYDAVHALAGPPSAALDQRIEGWKAALDDARRGVTNEELRRAIDFFLFHFHHDRGYPMVPSSYQEPDAFEHVPRLLYVMLKASGLPVGFAGPIETMRQAFTWLQDFWLARLDEEKAILAARS